MTLVNGLHHVTAMAGGAARIDRFYRDVLGLRRVKKTVNFDAPEVYHLYYGDAAGTPGSVMTTFPFPAMPRGRRGSGEVGEVAFAVAPGALDWWRARLTGAIAQDRFGERRLRFAGPDGEALALVERAGDARTPWGGGGVPEAAAIRGFHSVTLTLRDGAATGDLLRAMGHVAAGAEGAVQRFAVPGGNGADVVDVAVDAGAPRATQGAGSVHHVAFSVPDDAAQLRARAAMSAAGMQVTPVIDRDYFNAVYFRTPDGVLFEIATDTPGFARDEAEATLGCALKLPRQHEHLRDRLERVLPALPGDGPGDVVAKGGATAAS